MHRGAILFTTVAALACSGCLGDQGKLEVRSVNSGIKAEPQPVPYRIAEARSQMALGNVALALEGFRKAAREDPQSVDALAGIGQCYDEMRRFDLSRRYYEQALAIAPRDAALLALFANSLEQQGLRAEANSVRGEVLALLQAQPAAAALEPTEQEEVADARELEGAVAARVSVAPQPPVAAAAPPAPPVVAPVGKSVTIALAPPRPLEVAKAEPVRAAPPPVMPVGQSVTIALAPPKPAPVPVPAPAAKAPKLAVVSPVASAPRLERLSMTEIALFTGNGPKWVRPAQPALMMRSAMARPMGVRVLNAARVEKLAARTRSYLGQFGWRDIRVGDAAIARNKSVILYPQGARAEAAKLANRLGFATAPRADVRQLTILLGRDAAGHPGLRNKA